MGGMFCNGELGPIGSTTHLHGFTSVFAVFRGAGGGGSTEEGSKEEE